MANAPVALSRVVDIAASAGEVVMKRYRRGGTTATQKADRSPLTAADLESDRLIVDALRALDPSIPIISEEGGIPDYEVRRAWKRFWLVDPLDGTKEFLKRSDDFTVNIALIEDAAPALGVVLAPALGCLYWADAAGGAWKRIGGSDQRLRSSPASGADGWTIVESASHPSAELDGFLAGLRVKARVKTGSSLKFCRVAEGSADLYPRFGPTMEWDTAAGDCVYRFSGAAAPRVSPLAYNKESLRNGNFVIGGELLAAAARPR